MRSDSNSVCLIMRTDNMGYENMRKAHTDVHIPDRIAAAIPARKVEYFSGRVLAKHALMMLGSDEICVGTGKHREPLWPMGFVGSISHTQNFVSVLLTADIDCLVGIDMECRISEHACDSLTGVMSGCEVRVLAEAGFSISETYTIGFSAKETLFKALFPKVKRYLDFNQFVISSYDRIKSSIDIKYLSENTTNIYSISLLDFNVLTVTSLVTGDGFRNQYNIG